MNDEWDELKRQANNAKHGDDFSLAEEFDWDTAQIERDSRFEYGETRSNAFGRIEDRLFVLVFTQRNNNTVRLIGLRKVNKREILKWKSENQTTLAKKTGRPGISLN
ncbi:MAG: BrnT family toxin [Nitrospirae bacterium]|nr:BrnT family toxin [Nitrospirota bacterium]MCL5285213.1 BrnT family toxin [Nitrospirota bacterium]